MAVVNTKSPELINADTIPPVLNDRAKRGLGMLGRVSGVVQIVNGDSIASTYRLARIYSGWIVDAIVRKNDAIAGITTVHIGLYDTLANGGAVVTAALFASAVDCSAGSLVGVDHRIAAGATEATCVNLNKKIWEVLGLAADPNKWYDLVATINAAATATGYFSLRADYRY